MQSTQSNMMEQEDILARQEIDYETFKVDTAEKREELAKTM